ncbi:MAG: hypothetical protein KGZ79_04195 [Dethiobacter sp.]|nr:hypothetical protein [Dethiobacter sp.]
MIIAIPSDDGKTISAHLGHSRNFIIYEIAEGGAQKKEERQRQGSQACGCHSNEPEASSNGHTTLFDVLKDVDLVIAGGMGKKMFEELLSAGIVAITTDETDSETAVKSYLAGTLRGGGGTLCGCNH